MKNDLVYISDMLEHALVATGYAARGREHYFRTLEIQDACIRRIEVVGEASSRVSSEFRARYPEIPWKEIYKMRNRLIHGYNRINLNRVWTIVSQELPPLIVQLERILAENPFEED